MKTCSKCKIEQPYSNFHKHSYAKDGYRSACKACRLIENDVNKEQINAYHRNYYWNNKEKVQLKNSKCYVKFRDTRIKNSLQYYEDNKETIIKRATKYTIERHNSDPQFRLARNLRSRLYNAIKNNNKTGSAVQDLGMPIPAFLCYLNLGCIDRYGEPYTGNEHKYHLDHIVPLSSFDLSDREQLLKAVKWDNIQVLTARENISKGARIL